MLAVALTFVAAPANLIREHPITSADNGRNGGDFHFIAFRCPTEGGMGMGMANQLELNSIYEGLVPSGNPASVCLSLHLVAGKVLLHEVLHVSKLLEIQSNVASGRVAVPV